ncbi:hypothetical protein [Streptomyces sp. NPDC004291]
MSKKQSNRKRAAILCSRATGMAYSRCIESAVSGHITPLRPVPDANSPEQRSFEARIAHTLAYALRDRQLDSAVLGVQGVRLQGEQLTLRLHPVMAGRIVADLLPVFDAAYGGLRGVPGLRVRYRAGEWFLADVGSSARVHLEGFGLHSDPKLPTAERGLTAVWRDVPDRLSRIERDEIVSWDTGGGYRCTTGARDLLFSRILRRPLLVNRAGASHGWVNTYSHHDLDIVFEWCCGVEAEKLADALRASGVENTIETIDFRASFDREPHAERIDMGDASIVLRCLNASWCRDDGWAGPAMVARSNLRRYQ